MLTILTSQMKNKIRLYVEYALIALLVVTAGLTLTMWLQKQSIEKRLGDTKSDLVAVKSRLTTAEEINRIQQDRINELQHDYSNFGCLFYRNCEPDSIGDKSRQIVSTQTAIN